MRALACSTSTGYATAESHVNVLPDGTVVMTPAVLPQGTLGIGQVTGRWFFESYGPIPLNPAFGPYQEGPSHLNVTADQGRTWTHSVITDTQITENAQFTSGPAPRGGDRPVGYSRVTYYCANISVGFTSPLIAQRSCYRSLSYLAQHRGDSRYYGDVALLPDPRTLWTSRGTTVLSGQVVKGPLLYATSPLGSPAVSGAGTVPVAPGVDVPFPPPFDIQLLGNDFIGVAIGPDGTPWGSFTQDCGPTPDAPACRANGGQTRGAVGRLVRF